MRAWPPWQIDDDNNCAASPGTAAMGEADLVVGSLGDFPASVAAGGSFFAMDVTSNAGRRSTPTSTNRFWLSQDDVVGDDLPLTGSRVVPSIPVGASSAGWADDAGAIACSASSAMATTRPSATMSRRPRRAT